jgi:hypothetical protein
LPDRLFRVGRTRYYGLKTFWSTSELVPITLEDVQHKADELISTLADCGMSDAIALTSPISVFEKTALGQQTYSSIPKGHEILPSCFEALEYASRCDKREWVSAYQLGHWDTNQIWDYDLSSAYGSIASDLLNLNDLEFWKSDKLGVNEERAYYGFLRGHLCLDPSAEWIHTSPIIADLDRIPGNPAGDFGSDYYLTLDEYRFITRYSLGEFKMSSGWFLHPRAGVHPSQPFRSIMARLYEQRYRSDLASTIMKGVANQLVGKLIETRVDGSYGEIRNDIYHSIILSQARVKVAEFLINNEVTKEELVVVQTDGVRLAREIHLSGNGFGKWRCNDSRPTIVASPYKVYTDDKKPAHLTYDHIVSMIHDHPMSQYYARTVPHRTTLRQALQQGDISLVGQMDDLPAHLDLNAITREQNRNFGGKFPKNGSALLNNKYQSAPAIL